MYPFPQWLGALPVIMVFCMFTPLSQADDVNNATQNTVEVVNSTLANLKIKRLGSAVKVQYTFQTQKRTEPFDVYIAYTKNNVANELWFIQPSGEFTQTPKPYYTQVSHDLEEIVLDFTLSTDLNLVGEYHFYAALLKAGTEVSNLAPSEWPLVELSHDNVFVSR